MVKAGSFGAVTWECTSDAWWSFLTLRGYVQLYKMSSLNARHDMQENNLTERRSLMQISRSMHFEPNSRIPVVAWYATTSRFPFTSIPES